MPPLDPLSSESRVAVRLPNALGDCVMATASLKRLAAVIKPANLALIGSPANLALLDGNPWSTTAIIFDRKGKDRGLGGFLETCRRIRRFQPDLTLLLPNSFGTALMAWLGGSSLRIGYFRDGRRFLLSHGLKRACDERGRFLPEYTGSYYLNLLDLIPSLPPVDPHPQLFETARGREEAAAWRVHSGLASEEPYMIVVPGASFGPSKVWVVPRYAEVCRELAKRYGARVFISTGPGEEGIGNEVRSQLGDAALASHNLSLHGLKSVFAGARFVLTNDTGPRHIAVAFNIPNVTIMGSVDPRLSLLESEVGEVVREAVECSPCGKKVCPLAEQICMTRISTTRVLDACTRVWPGQPQA